MRNISCGFSSGIADILSSFTDGSAAKAAPAASQKRNRKKYH